MKKFTRFMLITALCLALAGAAMTFIGVRKCIRFVERYKPAEAVERHFDIDPGAFDALTLTAGTAKVVFEPAAQPFVHAEGFAESDVTITQQNGTVTVDCRDLGVGDSMLNIGILRIDWFGKMHVDTLKKKVITIGIPEGTELDNLTVDVTTGDITCPVPLTAQTLSLHSVTGDVTLDACRITQSGSVKLVTGDIVLNGGNWNDLTLKTTTGDVLLTPDDAADNYCAELRTTTGRITAENAALEALGKKHFVLNPDMSSLKPLSVRVTTGDIRLVFPDA